MLKRWSALNKNTTGLISAAVLLAWAIGMGSWHFLLEGISASFLMGFAVGSSLLVAMLAFLAREHRLSRTADGEFEGAPRRITGTGRTALHK